MIGLVLEHGLSVEAELEEECGEQNQILPAPINESITDVMQDGGSSRWISARSGVLLLSALAASLLLILQWIPLGESDAHSVPKIATIAYTSHARWGKWKSTTG